MKKVFAFFLLLLGIGLVVSGVFYKEILNYLGINTEFETNKNGTPKEMVCIKKENNNDAELSLSETSRMHFDSKGLVSINDDVVISPIDNSEESLDKLERYYQKMQDFFEDSKNKNEAVDVKYKFDTNMIKYNMEITLKDLNKNSNKKKNDADSQEVEENNSTDNVNQNVEGVIETDEDGNAVLTFSSIDTDYKSNFSYHDSYEEVKKLREKEKYTCS